MSERPEIPGNTSAFDEYGRPARQRLPVKALLVIILGCVVLSLQLSSMLGFFMIGSVVTVWGILFIIVDFAVVAAMVFCALKKKVPAVVFSASALIAAVAELAISIGRTVQLIREPDALPEALGLSSLADYADTFVSDGISILLIVLLLLYAVLRFRHGNSVVWLILFLVLYLSEYVIVPLLFGGFQYYFRFESVMDVLQAFSILAFCAFCVIGYSPDKWYRRQNNS